jgi:ubiquinone/menaquinone biosynthesis C-methylase UbiE
MTLLNSDIHSLPFQDNSFDTVVDTFGLECCYDMERAYTEMKRLCKKDGKILLLERGQSLWLSDNFKLLRKASVNLGARGQIYHHDFSSLIDNDSSVEVVEKKRLKSGMLYFYVLKKK